MAKVSSLLYSMKAEVQSFEEDSSISAGIYISFLVAGGAADSTGQLQPGDRILAVSQSVRVL